MFFEVSPVFFEIYYLFRVVVSSPKRRIFEGDERDDDFLAAHKKHFTTRTFLSEHTHANIIHDTRYTIHDTKYEIHDTRIHAVHLKGASERARDTYSRTITE